MAKIKTATIHDLREAENHWRGADRHEATILAYPCRPPRRRPIASFFEKQRHSSDISANTAEDRSVQNFELGST